ncbi:hypothetical protein HYW20_00455 [Candidatus Woesearchaeota archaeon]|nr:hypothetical protein [Candidatus Woesearchaeota archaeon]
MEEGGLDGRLEAEATGSHIEEAPEPREEGTAEYDSGEKIVYNSKEARESKQAKPKKEEKMKFKSKNLDSIVASNESGDHNQVVYKGTVIIFYNVETGEILTEENPLNYTLKEERGKLRPIGGQKEPYDFSPEDTAVRELREEVAQKDIQDLLIKSFLRNRISIGTLRETINGHLNETEVYEARVSYQDWIRVRQIKESHDAGKFYIKTYDEGRSMPDSKFASVYGSIYKGVILEKIVKNKDFLKYSKYTNNSSIPFITTNSIHFNTVNSFNIYSPSSN